MHSQIQYWRDNEAEKIHSDYEGKREDILGDAFQAGLEGHIKSDSIMQDINARSHALNQQEAAAVNEIHEKAEQYERERLDRLEADRQESVRRAWSVLHK